MPSDATEPVNLHGTAIAVSGRAVLIRGPSGAGKSDLALRVIAMAPGPLLTHQAMLVADDRVIARRLGNMVDVSAPAALAGLLEVRGIGIVRVPYAASAGLVLIADLVEHAAVQRLPEALEPEEVCGIMIPRVLAFPFEAAAPIKLLLALHSHGTARH